MSSSISRSGIGLNGLYLSMPMLLGSLSTINTPIGIIRRKRITHTGTGSRITNTHTDGQRCKSDTNIYLRPCKSNDVNRICRWYSSESLELRKKRLLFRAMNTGMKELDLILPEFIRLNPDFIDANLSEFESFLDMETCTIYDILMGKVDYNEGNEVVYHIKSFVTSM
nr:hypothetical protein MACL_00001744 [Theileria orientalis]